MPRMRQRDHIRVEPVDEEQPERGCDVPGCDNEGVYRAPRSRRMLSEYYWFCLEHVRHYNGAWNYYEGLSPEEIEAHIRHDTSWRRPTWRLGDGLRYARSGITDEFGLFDDNDDNGAARRGNGAGTRGNGRNGREHTESELRALALLDLDPPVTFAHIKTRYKELAKRYHPDANGGDRTTEERLKAVNEAYTVLRSVYSRRP